MSTGSHAFTEQEKTSTPLQLQSKTEKLTLSKFLQWAVQHQHPQVINLYKNFFVNVVTDGLGYEAISQSQLKAHLDTVLNGCKSKMFD